MKLLICSDIHGDLGGIESVFEKFEEEKCDKILILGDILYHGPRNDLPERYAPKKVIELLNENKNSIMALRGNCDTEVDQMVLEFPILADYIYLNIDGHSIFATHGHNFNLSALPPLKPGEVLLHGHTHVPAADFFGEGNLYINPGSTSIPKGGYEPSYAVFENGVFEIKDFKGKTIMKASL